MSMYRADKGWFYIAIIKRYTYYTYITFSWVHYDYLNFTVVTYIIGFVCNKGDEMVRCEPDDTDSLTK